MSDPVDRLLARLHGVRESGRGWMAQCPAHEDRKASLSVSRGDNGGVLLKCQAGCATNDVVEAIGLTMRDLYPPRGDGDAPNPKRRIVATYDYRDESGKLLYQSVRYEPKGFSQRRPGERGALVPNMDGVRRVPIGFPTSKDARRWSSSRERKTRIGSGI